MLMRTDPFRELDRLTQQVFGTNGTLARPSVMPMDAWRDGDTFHVEFDLPGVNPDSIDLDVERNVVTVKAERPARASDAELIAAERPRGVFSRPQAGPAGTRSALDAWAGGPYQRPPPTPQTYPDTSGRPARTGVLRPPPESADRPFGRR